MKHLYRIIIATLVLTLSCQQFHSPSADGNTKNGVVYASTAAVPASVFKFQPGGTAGAGVYATWVTLMAAVALSPGDKDILVDDSLAAAHMTAGGPYNLDNVTFDGLASSATETLIIDTGATFTSSAIYVRNGLILKCEAAAPPWTPGSFFNLYIEGNGTNAQSAAGAAPLLSVTAPANFGGLFVGSGATLGDGTHNVVTIAAGQTAVVGVGGGEGVPGHVLAHTFGGAGTAGFVLASEAIVATPQDSLSTTSNSAKAAQVSFSPGVGANWNPVPTLTNAALDQLAAPNFVQAAANTGTGTGTSTAVTGNIAKLRSGKVNVSGSVSGIMTAGGTVTVSLLRDATPILALGALTYLATSSYSIPIEFIDTLPDTANHTYTVKAVASAGNLTVPANGNGIVVTEM